MGLGNNRDYKSNSRRVETNLALYAQIVKDFTGNGTSKEEAEKLAGEMVLRPVAYYRTLAEVVIEDGIRETQFLSTVKYSALRRAARIAYRQIKAENEARARQLLAELREAND